MTTAVLNSVESDKSGVASAVNGAIREIGTAFGIALLGTIATRKYQEQFRSSNDIEALRQDSGNGFLQSTLDTIGSGASYGGNFIKSLPGTEQLGGAVATIERQSGMAFVSGMELAFVIGSLALIGGSVVSYFIMSDNISPVNAHDEQGSVVHVDTNPVPAPGD